MSYLSFFIVLMLAGAMWGLVRLFGGKASFGIFKLIAINLVMLPVATAAFLFWLHREVVWVILAQF